MNGELLRLVEAIQKERAIEKEMVFLCIEQAIASAVKKHIEAQEDPIVKIDRKTGHIEAFYQGKAIEPVTLGRIAAQSAKQLIFQKIREAERDMLFHQFEGRKGDIVTAQVSRYEGPHVVFLVGKTEAIMLKSEQVPGESYKVGDRLRAYVLNVEKRGTATKVYLSRASENFVKRLFELEVPEIADSTITIKGIVREAGYRTKMAVTSSNEKVDCVGACVGVRGARIRTIIEELVGENMDIIRWSESLVEFVKEALKPATVSKIAIDEEKKHATVHVTKDQLSQAIGKGGRNVRLASKLTGWEIDIFELAEGKTQAAEQSTPVPKET